ncbi:hypothetical protein CDL12_09195 [Handroanthus impetiginosus]|uniref:BHLH domain-containing protein n=1 Tax=Handroanthus impetiginosus TaxID=429701 RepID=A0A2G9HKS7_9LAMI|nr:hypothetical protein CDL12_09195 [Handroanthus impetiginosus]
MFFCFFTHFQTDTACVLYETIEYIKFLRGQISALSTMYKKNGAPTGHHQQNSDKPEDPEGPHHDLRSQGLFLVPVSSAFLVTHETAVAFGALRVEKVPDKK